MICDELGRKFETLRLSLTPACNFMCRYCVDSLDKENKTSKNRSLKPQEYVQLVEKIHKINPLQTVRLTGGEPLLYKPITNIIKLLKDIGIKKVKLTSNAKNLRGKAKKLKEAGLHSLNISLDAIESNSFYGISRRDELNHVLQGIEAALEVGLPLKLNATIMKGVNESQIVPLFEYSKSIGVPIRFLELMKMGPLFHNHERYFYSESQILNKIKEYESIYLLPRKKSSTAKYWQTKAGHKFGIISNHSDSFCYDCNRLRMDHKGKIYGCLTVDEGLDIRSISNENSSLRFLLRKSLSQKQTVFTGSEVSMKAIGG